MSTTSQEVDDVAGRLGGQLSLAGPIQPAPHEPGGMGQ
jgi:hypothetical protein